MYRIIESKLRERFKDNPKESVHITHTAQTTNVKLFFPITTHYEF